MLSEDNKVVQSLWIGDSLSPMEQMSIRSYLRQGHEYHLYTYSKITNVPKGAVLKDAAEIIPTTLLDYTKFPKLALFADFFRYKLLLDRGGWWVDTDSVCVQPFDFPSPFAFSSEILKEGGIHINNGTIKSPKGSEIMQYLWDKCLAMDIPNIKWGASGPALIQAAVDHFQLRKFVQMPAVFCPIPWWDAPKIVDPKEKLLVPRGAYAVHLYNEVWSWSKMDKSKFPVGSLYERLHSAQRVSLKDVTAVIKTFLRDKSLFHCVRTLRAQYPDMPIIVADDGYCTHEKGTKLKEMGVTKYIELPWNRGLSTGRNVLIDEVETPYVLMCEDDFGFVEESHIERLRKLTGVADIAAGIVFNAQHWACHGDGVGWDSFGGCFTRVDGKPHRTGFTGQQKVYEGVTYEVADFVLNFFVARTESLKKVRWDESLRLAFEHMDFFLRAQTAGLRTVRTLEAQVVHREVDDVHNPEYQKHREDYEKYRPLFAKKWGVDDVAVLRGSPLSAPIAVAPPVPEVEMKPAPDHLTTAIPINWEERNKQAAEARHKKLMEEKPRPRPVRGDGTYL